MRRELSGIGETYFCKYVIPIIFICGLGWSALSMWSGKFQGDNESASSAVTRWMFLIGWIVISLLLVEWARSLKRIEADDKNLYVSNFSSNAVIPLVEISDVTRRWWCRPALVTIHFYGKTEAGTHATFVPPYGSLGVKSHPVVTELLALRDQARSRAETKSAA